MIKKILVGKINQSDFMVSWKVKKLNYLILQKPKSKLTFVHTPKCGGTSISEVLKNTNIINLGHNLSENTNNIVFTVIRNPIDRFESFLNYRLQSKPRKDWPKNLNYVYDSFDFDLNYILNNLSDEDILNFHPFKTLKFWSKNVDFFISIDEFEGFLSYFGYENILLPKKNFSEKKRGTLNIENRKRLCNIYIEDFQLYNLWCK